MGVLTYENLYLLNKDIIYNSMAVHSNLGVIQHGYLRLVVSPTNYALLTNTLFVCKLHPRKLIIPIADTRHSQE